MTRCVHTNTSSVSSIFYSAEDRMEILVYIFLSTVVVPFLKRKTLGSQCDLPPWCYCFSYFSYLVTYECFLLIAMALKLVETWVSSVESTNGPRILNGTGSTAKLANLEKG